MPRATRGQIDRRLLYLRSKGLDLQLNTNATGYRIETGDGRRDLSPRLNMREMIDWLEAFETGWECGREKTGANERERGNRAGDHPTQVGPATD